MLPMSYPWLVLSKEPFHMVVSYLSWRRGETHTEIFSSSRGLGSDVIGKVSRNLCSPSFRFNVKAPKVFQKESDIYWFLERRRSFLKQNVSRRIYNTYYSTCFFMLTHHYWKSKGARLQWKLEKDFLMGTYIVTQPTPKTSYLYLDKLVNNCFLIINAFNTRMISLHTTLYNKWRK